MNIGDWKSKETIELSDLADLYDSPLFNKFYKASGERAIAIEQTTPTNYKIHYFEASGKTGGETKKPIFMSPAFSMDHPRFVPALEDFLNEELYVYRSPLVEVDRSISKQKVFNELIDYHERVYNSYNGITLAVAPSIARPPVNNGGFFMDIYSTDFNLKKA